MTKDILEIKTIHLTMGVSKEYCVDENTMHYGLECNDVHRLAQRNEAVSQQEVYLIW